MATNALAPPVRNALLAGVLPGVYSYSSLMKRNLKDLWNNPSEYMSQAIANFGEQNTDQRNLFANAYPMLGYRTVLNTPEQIAQFRQEAANQAANQAMQAATVWHGSPHKFNKFDSSKIGTGEGAQAYGHGLYLADAQEVASGYKRAGESAAPIQYQGEGIMNWALGNRDAVKALPKETQKALAYARDFASVDEAKRMALMSGKPDVVSEIDRLNKLGVLKDGPEGSLYKVDLPDEHIAKMLDWDKPLSQQAPEVQAALSELGLPTSHWGNISGESALKKLGDKGAAEKLLIQKGIPGIRYLDGGSRNTSAGELLGVTQGAGGWQAKIRKTPAGQVGDLIPMANSFTTSKPFPTEQAARDWANTQLGGGTSNYVVFPGNEDLLKILERNGIPMSPEQFRAKARKFFVK